MPKLAVISQRDAVRVFEQLGYRVARQSVHIVMTNGKTRLVIPRHNPINALTMGSIAKDAGLTPEQFRALLSNLSDHCSARQPPTMPKRVERNAVYLRRGGSVHIRTCRLHLDGERSANPLATISRFDQPNRPSCLARQMLLQPPSITPSMRRFHALLLAGLACLLPAILQAQGVQSPQGELLQAADGSFYGTSAEGGSGASGTLFNVTPASEVTVLVHFTGAASGSLPSAGLVRDAAGQLWGTTQAGGTGFGTIFKFNPATRVLSTVHSFAGTDGSEPAAALVPDGAGNLWSTTSRGGAGDHGTLFRINVASGALTTAIQFTGTSGAAKGARPLAAVLFDASGALWGTASEGGALNLGTIYRYDPASPTFTTVIEFSGTSGAFAGETPVAALVADSAGALWGTTREGGIADAGTLFRFTPGSSVPTDGTFARVLDFTGPNGAKPSAPLWRDGSGNFWGTTRIGGNADLGTVFRFNVTAGTLVTVAHLTGRAGAARGAFPLGGLRPDGLGNLWGTASQGGREYRGVLFRVAATTTGAYELIAEPSSKPTAPLASVQAPPGAMLTGAAGAMITLRGTASDNLELAQVLVSLNGGPAVPATLLPAVKPGGKPTWELSVVPENGINVAIVRSVDRAGDTSRPVTLRFQYTVRRPELAGPYAGLLTPAAGVPTPGDFTGRITFNATATGRFTGQLVVSGLPKPVRLTGSLGNNGLIRFGSTGASGLVILRGKLLPPWFLTAQVDLATTPAGALTGVLLENGVPLADLTGHFAPYTSRRSPVLPLRPVPLTLLDPARDKGAYTAAILPLAPTDQQLPAEAFPQGAGYAVVKIASSGVVTVTGKLADGTRLATRGALLQGDALPVYAKLPGRAASISGVLRFRNVPGSSDADGPNWQWHRPANPKATNYRAGWPDGILVDAVASKFLLPAVSQLSLLGNAVSTGGANAVLSCTGIGPVLANELTVGTGAVVTVLGPPPGVIGGEATLKIGPTGLLMGKLTAPSLSGPVTLQGIVLQKTATAHGYFLGRPVGALATDPATSGNVRVTGR